MEASALRRLSCGAPAVSNIGRPCVVLSWPAPVALSRGLLSPAWPPHHVALLVDRILEDARIEVRASTTITAVELRAHARVNSGQEGRTENASCRLLACSLHRGGRWLRWLSEARSRHGGFVLTERSLAESDSRSVGVLGRARAVSRPLSGAVRGRPPAPGSHQAGGHGRRGRLSSRAGPCTSTLASHI